jgi:molybdenum cofactor cytidylyltransferase
MIAGLVLAAGGSSRLGRPKQLLPLQGRPIVQHVVDAALAAGLAEVVVVLGHAAEKVLAGLDLRPPARAVVNPDHAAGQSSSLRVGLRATGADVSAAIVLLGDQPGIAVEAIRAVADAYERTGGPVVRAVYAGRPGHPVLFDRSVWPEVQAIEGDHGARDLLARHPDWIVEVPVEGERPADLDTWDDYRRLRKTRNG